MRLIVGDERADKERCDLCREIAPPIYTCYPVNDEPETVRPRLEDLALCWECITALEARSREMWRSWDLGACSYVERRKRR